MPIDNIDIEPEYDSNSIYNYKKDIKSEKESDNYNEWLKDKNEKAGSPFGKPDESDN